MPEPKIDKRLMRLISSRLYPNEDPRKYATELRQFADNAAKVDEAEKQCKLFKALADTTRLRILKLLSAREMCVCEVMIALDLTQPTVSHHLKMLENAGLVTRRKEGRWVYYSIKNPKIIESMFQ